jgi:hypothetical protein
MLRLIVSPASLELHFKFKLSYDRKSVSQSVLVSGHQLGPVTNFSFPGLASAVALESMTRRTREHILLPHIGLDLLFIASEDSQRYSGGILTNLHTRFK